jgi:hypothetical protein
LEDWRLQYSQLSKTRQIGLVDDSFLGTVALGLHFSTINRPKKYVFDIAMTTGTQDWLMQCNGCCNAFAGMFHAPALLIVVIS